jgi:CheY-like chemotaxis protein
MPSKKTILLAEDEQAIRRVLVDSIEKIGFSVIEAANGEEGYALAISKKPDCIILDVIMPKMHGLEVLEKIRAEAGDWGKKVPIILLTNFADDPRVIEANKLGKCELLSKTNIRLDDVVKRIKETIV